MDQNLKVRSLMIAGVAAAVIIAGIVVGFFLISRYHKNKISQPQTNISSQDTLESTGEISHKHNYTVEIISASCENSGYTLHTCTLCGFQTSDNEVAATGHTWSSWSVTQNASANAPGEKSRTCQICGVTETEEIPKTTNPGHVHSYVSSVVQPTCISGGYTRYTCSCGKSYDSDTTPVRSHSYGNWAITTQATTSSPGSRTRSCSRCGYVLTEVIPMLSTENADKDENYIDPRIEIETLSDGAMRYYYNPVCLVDTRTWGVPPAISITAEGGFYVTYFKQDGSKVEVNLAPMEGYVRRMVIMEDGSYMLSLIGGFDD